MSTFEINNLEGLFNGFNWIDGPVNVRVVNGLIEEIFGGIQNNPDIDGSGKFVCPPFVDGHNHLIFAGDRFFELPLKVSGVSYSQILSEGGGILSTVNATRAASDEELEELVIQRLDIMLKNGTLITEAKSGYGLTIKDELRLLGILNKIDHPVQILPTYCGAHAIPDVLKRSEYVEEVIDTLPIIKKKSLSNVVDVFCDRGAFTVEETKKIFNAAVDLNLRIKVHGDELEYTGISRIAATEFDALSVDHLLHTPKEDFIAISKTNTSLMFMPTAPLGLFTQKFPVGWNGLNLNIGLGSDFNPNNYTLSMQTAVRMAVFLYRLKPVDALKAATMGSFRGITGSDANQLSVGAEANFLTIQARSINEFVAKLGQNLVTSVYKNGTNLVKSFKA